jgi:hypothetical protein
MTYPSPLVGEGAARFSARRVRGNSSFRRKPESSEQENPHPEERAKPASRRVPPPRRGGTAHETALVGAHLQPFARASRLRKSQHAEKYLKNAIGKLYNNLLSIFLAQLSKKLERNQCKNGAQMAREMSPKGEKSS